MGYGIVAAADLVAKNGTHKSVFFIFLNFVIF